MSSQDEGPPTPGSGEMANTLAVLGGLGLIPFAAPPLAALSGVLSPSLAWIAQATYAAAILAFLGGVRAAVAAMGPRPDRASLLISMLPPLIGAAAAAVVARAPTGEGVALGLIGLALALALQGVWDITARTLPDWYRQLRAPLTVVACGALVIGAWRSGGAA